MNKKLKAVFTMVAGTIGVGFLALPYSIYKFGTFWGIGCLVLVSLLTLVGNLAYSSIVLKDKGNKQLPGYTNKYLNYSLSHIVTFIVIIGSFGILLAYSILAGESLRFLVGNFNINLSASFLGLLFVMISIFVMKYGMKVISRISTLAIVIIISSIILLVAISIPEISSDNISSLNWNYFSLIFGVSIFAMFSVTTVPVIDEIIGYNKKDYNVVVSVSTIITAFIYIIFGLVLTLAFGDNLTSTLIDSFGAKYIFLSNILSVLTLFAIFTSFILIANNIKEILNYDYKLSPKVSVLVITTILIWLMVFSFLDFETLLSLVGNFSMVLQYIIIFCIWFIIKKEASWIYKVIVIISAIALSFGIFIQI